MDGPTEECTSHKDPSYSGTNGLMRDPGLYKDPEVFEPGRWLARDAIVGVEERKDVDVDVDREDEAGKERDPRTFVFEFGRRRDFDFGVALFGTSSHSSSSSSSPHTTLPFQQPKNWHPPTVAAQEPTSSNLRYGF
ncbi:hypothetical protein P692DRAFT_201871340 [Suillus brevipes Sb2]|nr:hypothetical protein P692DRAFT_201871340 [Suillus brevipes Sb2]